MAAWFNNSESRHETSRRGQRAEQAALAYLQKRGLTLVVCNYRSPHGEIDLIMRESGTLVFIEVRQRSNDRFCHAVETIDARKQQRLRATAEHYLQRHAAHAAAPVCRFDVITLTGRGNDTVYQWLRDAF